MLGYYLHPGQSIKEDEWKTEIDIVYVNIVVLIKAFNDFVFVLLQCCCCQGKQEDIEDEEEQVRSEPTI